MDGFRKPYEYMEEKGVSGFLLIYFLMLLAVETLLGVITLFYGFNLLPVSRVLGMIIVGISVVYILFSLFSAIVLKKLKKFAVRVSKVFLVFRAVYLIPYIVWTTISQISEIPQGIDHETYSQMIGSIIVSSAISLLFVIAFSIGWFIYLNRSKKVRVLFPDGPGSSKEPVRESV
jgi:hypothetical protein